MKNCPPKRTLFLPEFTPRHSCSSRNDRVVECSRPPSVTVTLMAGVSSGMKYARQKYPLSRTGTALPLMVTTAPGATRPRTPTLRGPAGTKVFSGGDVWTTSRGALSRPQSLRRFGGVFPSGRPGRGCGHGRTARRAGTARRDAVGVEPEGVFADPVFDLP